MPFNLLPSSSCLSCSWQLWTCKNLLHLLPSFAPFSSPPVMSAGCHRRPGRRMFLHGIFLGHRCYLEGKRKKPHSTWICLTNGWGKNAIDAIVCPKLCFWGNLVAFFLVEIQFHLGGAAHSMAVNYNSSIWMKQIWKKYLLNRPFRWPTWFDIIIIHLNWNIMMHIYFMLYSHVLLSLSSLNFREMKQEQIINNPPQWNKFQPTRPQSQHQSQPFMTPHWHRLNQQFAACIVDWQPALDTCWNYQQCSDVWGLHHLRKKS